MIRQLALPSLLPRKGASMRSGAVPLFRCNACWLCGAGAGYMAFFEMRVISFQHTATQIRTGAKTVTRRTGWKSLTEGTQLLACRKVRGVRVEDRDELAVIRVTGVRLEPLRRMLDDSNYGRQEIRLEGFEGHPELGSPAAWVGWFCRTHRGCTLDTIVTRIEFRASSAKS
jgi:hypothetical protein